MSLLQWHERNKHYWMRHSIASLLERHESTVSLLQRCILYWSLDWVSHSIASLLKWHSKWVCYNDIRIQFNNKSLTHIFYDLFLFMTLITTTKMICTADRVAYTICLERIEHILYIWKQKDMSWNSFIIEYLKLNRKNLLEWQE